VNGPLITKLPLWERHEQRVLGVLRTALSRMRNTSHRGDERALNRQLHGLLRQVNKENTDSDSDLWVEQMPILEARNPPTPHTRGLPSENKIPDLQWRYEDHQEKNPLLSERVFVIECKRLDNSPSRGSKLSRLYVDKGVLRFAHTDWRYGKDVASGAMVGYVESHTLQNIVAAVNRKLIHHQMPPLTLPQPARSPLTEMKHTFDRSFAISPFRLIHLWIDIRPTRWQVCMNFLPIRPQGQPGA